MNGRTAIHTVAGALALLLTACANTRPVEVPDPLRAGANESLAMIVPAKGVQIYECRGTKADAAAYEWVFVAPDAELFDARGNTIGRHGAGPYWEATDGSRIVGALKARAAAPVAGAVPWLLLTAKPTGTAGSFSKVTSIQRVNTTGGVAPAAGCGRDTAGTSARVAYTADYVFFSPR
ncbi:MAG: DUF3455 domain-containing protein [Burkholderiales bacterium]